MRTPYNDLAPIPPITMVDPHFPTTMGNSTLFIIGTLICCFITIFAVLAIVLIRPENKDAITTVIAIMMPITTALLTAGIYGVQKGVNGRFSQLLNATAERASTQGRASVIRQLYYQLSQMDPETAEFQEMSKTIRTEAMRHFEAVEHRTRVGDQPGEPPISRSSTATATAPGSGSIKTAPREPSL